MCFGTPGEPTEGSAEGPSTTVWPHQLHHHGGILTGEEVLAGMPFLNKCPIIILFNSRVSHNFMSSRCAKKAKLSVVAMEVPYVTSTTGGRVDADRII
jgi:hypothetical protein